MMGREIDTEIFIDASAESVWHVLTDFAAYPDWNPFIRTIEGQAIHARNKMEPPTRAVFEAMNRALKARAEIPAGKD